MAGLTGVSGVPRVTPTPGINAEVAPALGRQRGVIGDMAELGGGRRAYATVPPVAAIAPTPAPTSPIAAQLAPLVAKSVSTLGGPGISPMAAAPGIGAEVAPQMIDPLAALRSRQFSDGFNFPGF